MILESPCILVDFLKLHEDACNLLRKHPEEEARLVHRVMKIIDENFAREVFPVSPKYCQPSRRCIDSVLAYPAGAAGDGIPCQGSDEGGNILHQRH
jgi:hypothetical protein